MASLCLSCLNLELVWVYSRPFFSGRTSLVAQKVKGLPTMWETQVWSLGWEDPLEKEMATHSSTLACKIPWMEERGGLQTMGSQRGRQDWVTSLWLSFFSGTKNLWTTKWCCLIQTWGWSSKKRKRFPVLKTCCLR